MTSKIEYSQTINSIKNCIGKRVSDVARIQYYFNDEEDSDGFGNLEITFADNSFLTLKGVGDAESIMADNKKAEVYEAFNVTDTDIASWKRLDLKGHKEWQKIIGQTLENVELEWFLYITTYDRLAACTLYFNTDDVTFFETGSDANEFYVNKPLKVVDRKKRTEKLKQ
jgi:hypothetical protein